MLSSGRIWINGLLVTILLALVWTAGCAPKAPKPANPTSVPTTTDITSTPAPVAPDIKIPTYGAKSAALKTNWTVDEMLQYSIEDEYMARAEYKYVIAAFGDQNPFSNIIAAEETHISALKGLYNARNMTVPPDKSGQYLVRPTSVKDSLSLGVEAEIANINMYKNFLTTSNLPDDVKIVFTQLKSGSESHLSAFENGLKRYQ